MAPTRAPSPLWLAMLLALSLAQVPSSGCGPSDFRPPSLVDRPRIVGMITSVAADATRATPVGGERVTVTPVLVEPEGEEGTLSTLWLACLAAPTRSGLPSCGSMPLAFGGPAAPGVVSPIVIDLPPIPPSPFGAPSLLLTLASCDGGATPALPADATSATQPTCTGGAEDARAELTVFTMPVGLEAEGANHHPSIDDEEIALRIGMGEERVWEATADPLPSGGCAALAETAALPRVTVTETDIPVVTLGWTSGPDDRETYEVFIEGASVAERRREALQISHFVTAGTFERQFSAVESGDPDDVRPEIEWTPPSRGDIDAAGEVVRFWWVARDLRGGMDVVARVLCVAPG